MNRAPTGSVVPKLLGLVGAGLCVMGAVPSTALASRVPRPNEREAITRAAVATDGGPFLLIRVSDIRVSTAGPWATANVATYQRKYPKHPEMVAEESFYRFDGRWLDTNNANTPERNPPAAVVADLGLPSNANPHHGASHVILIAVLSVLGFLLLCGVIGDVLTRLVKGPGPQPPEPNPPKPYPPEPQPGSEPYSYDPPKEKCMVCHGSGKMDCYTCHGNRSIPDPNTGEPIPCVVCQATGKSNVPCTNCHGTGWV